MAAVHLKLYSYNVNHTNICIFIVGRTTLNYNIKYEILKKRNDNKHKNIEL